MTVLIALKVSKFKFLYVVFDNYIIKTLTEVQNFDINSFIEIDVFNLNYWEKHISFSGKVYIHKCLKGLNLGQKLENNFEQIRSLYLSYNEKNKIDPVSYTCLLVDRVGKYNNYKFQTTSSNISESIEYYIFITNEETKKEETLLFKSKQEFENWFVDKDITWLDIENE